MLFKCSTNKGKTVRIEINPINILFRPSVYGIIVDENKVLLLIKQNIQQKFCPGGAIEPYEDIEMALHREILEETGISLNVEKFLGVRESFFYDENKTQVYHKILFYYLCSPVGKQILSKGNADEGTPKWFSIKDVKDQKIKTGNITKEFIDLL